MRAVAAPYKTTYFPILVRVILCQLGLLDRRANARGAASSSRGAGKNATLESASYENVTLALVMTVSAGN